MFDYRRYGRRGAMAWVGLALALSACEDMHSDYRTRHPNVVAKQTYTLLVEAPRPNTTITLSEQARMEQFVGTYRSRGEGVIEITLTDGVDSRDAALGIGGALVDAGLRPEEVVVRFNPTVATPAEGAEATVTRPPRAMLSFQGYVVQVPECGDWSQSSSFLPENSPPHNFGCATQRNIGLMVRDPRDLLRASASGAGDAQHVGDVLNKYRTGQKMGNPTEVRVTISDVAK